MLRQPPDFMKGGLVPMVSYADLFQFVIMLCAVATVTVLFTRKK